MFSTDRKHIPRIKFSYRMADPFNPKKGHLTGVPVVVCYIETETGWRDMAEREASFVKSSRGAIDKLLIVGKGYEYRVGWAMENNELFREVFNLALGICLEKIRDHIRGLAAEGHSIPYYTFQRFADRLSA